MPTPRASKASPMGGEFRSGPIAGTAIISGVTFARKSVVYAEVDGLAIFEGDIVLGTVEEVRAATAPSGDSGPLLSSIGITGAQFRWPNATVPYDIDAALPNQQRVTDAIAHWQANTPIRFVLRTAANAAQYNDYVHFQPSSGCSSSVGRRGGQQAINLGSGCSTGNAIHEIGHTIGLWHEQSRQDRDSFVQIVWANIDPALQSNFVQQITDGDDIGPYDYGSIMHYPATAFSINGQATIIPLQPIPPGVVMGQRTALSAGDIAGVNALYPTPRPTFKEVPKDPLFEPTTLKEPVSDTTIKEIRKDPISDPTIKEIRKDPISDPTIKEIRKDPISDPIPTFKEASGDIPGGGGGTLAEGGTIPGPGFPGFPGQPGLSFSPGAYPFVVGSPSRISGGPGDPLAEAAAQVQELAEAIMLLEQQHEQYLAAYDAAVQLFNALQQGQ